MTVSVSAFNLTNAIGAAGFLLSIIGYCIIRKIANRAPTPSRLYCNARICWIIGLLKIGVGVFEITYCGSSGGTWWGFILILFAIFWIVRGNKFRRNAQSLSVGYQSLEQNQQQQQPPQQPIDNNNQQQLNDDGSSTQHRRSLNAPQIVIVSDIDTNQPYGLNSSSSVYPGVASSSNALHQPMISSLSSQQYNIGDPSHSHPNPTPLIKNAVPPSPFTGSQNYNYSTPSISTPAILSPSMSIPMSTTITSTPRMIKTMPKTNEKRKKSKKHKKKKNDNDHDHDHDKKEEDDGKHENENEDETPKDPPIQTQTSRKTSEGNVTFT